jgi:hypothetical protein
LLARSYLNVRTSKNLSQRVKKTIKTLGSKTLRPICQKNQSLWAILKYNILEEFFYDCASRSRVANLFVARAKLFGKRLERAYFAHEVKIYKYKYLLF